MLYSLEEIYASGGRLPIVTLTIANESIGTLRYVLGYEDMQLWGDTYEKSAFTVSMPETRSQPLQSPCLSAPTAVFQISHSVLTE